MAKYNAMKKILTLSMFLLLAACSAKPFFSSEDGIGFDKETLDNPGEAVPAAQSHCAKYGKDAMLDVDGGGIIVFKCK